MLVKTKFRFLFIVIILAAIIFTTCDSPMGMGKQIDFIPPVLTLDPIPNPYYVREGSVLSGTVTDNDEVARVIFINNATGEELFPVIRVGEKWIIELKFTDEQNGEKIVGQIIAFDRAGNSGEPSIAFVTMIIDIRPPIVENIMIQRTDTRIARLKPFNELKFLETSDPRGEYKDELYSYQNGWFTISGVVNDEETKIEIISLDIYDARDVNHILLSLPVDNGYTNYFPRWSIREEDIINAGEAKWGNGYKANYYKKDGERYYYRVVIKAIDKSNNENIPVEEDEGYLCLFAKSDEPKGILDLAVGTIVARGTPLPVDFFDDDSLLWAYTGLLTEEQWYGDAAINTGTTIPSGTNEQKIAWLKDYLLGGGTVYNWLYDKHSAIAEDKTSEPIKELIQYKNDGKSLDEKLVYVPTGKGEFDYGHYVLFTLAADRKLAPHTGEGPEWTNTNIWTGRSWEVSVIDENAPLIVFDTDSGCPEENTFPKLTSGEFFNIIGYTLRENATGMNKVTKFRMAWIPYNMPDLQDRPRGADGYIKLVQDSLSKDFADMPAGVQYWDFTEDATPGSGKGLFKDEGIEEIESSKFERQSFTKKLSVLGGADDITPTTNNFMYDYKKPGPIVGGDYIPGKDGVLDLENETKLFVFYAVDNMGHEVFRQLRLLGNKTPPTLIIYDVSNYLDNSLFSGIPDPNNAIYNTSGFDGDLYYPDLNSFNAGKYATIKNIITATFPTELEDTIPFQIYPRGTILKYWVNADKSKGGDIAVKTITMKDITFTSAGSIVGSAYNTSNKDLTFCEYYPDVTQRTFLFEATDELGNVRQIQRTVAVTNAAKLDNITTTSQNGIYGIGKEIILQANFSSQVYLEGGVPHLNIRYSKNGDLFYDTIPCTNASSATSPTNSTAYLEFKFTVGENYGGNSIITNGNLVTLYDSTLFNPPSNNKRPIILPSGVKILDSNRKDPAFIPGYTNESVTMPIWTTAKYSLQENKPAINFDGIRPSINLVKVGGKDPVSGSYYFKNGETLELTLTADEDIRASGAPILSYLLLNKAGGEKELNSTKFIYQRPDGQNALVFSIPVNNITGDGVFSNFSLSNPAGIVDNADNSVNTTSVQGLQNLITSKPPIYIKKSIPAAPGARLTGNTAVNIGSTPTNKILYNVNPYLTILDSTAEWFDLEDVKEYSLDGGLSWVTFPTAKSGWTTIVSGNLTINNGDWDLRVRYKDRAGNEGTQTRQLIQVNKDFPKLVSITAVQPNSTYKQGDKLEFHLEFAEPVKTTDDNNAKITLTNRATVTLNTETGSVAPSNEVVLTATASPTNNPSTPTDESLSTTIKFEWTLNGKEMPDGLYVSKIELAGTTIAGNPNAGALQDSFGNYGVNSTSATTAIVNMPASTNYTCPNLNGEKLIVDCINPVLKTTVPANGGVSANNTTITITFNEPVMIGTGKITVRPYDDYKIPAVLENNGYTNAKGTYVAGFYDIYNSNLLSASDRQILTQSKNSTNPSMGNLYLDERSGQSEGPYVKLTHGLKEGPGFTGTYLSAGTDAPGMAGAFMVPDTATKWVLNYRYSIDNANNTQYANTSDVLTTPSLTVVPNIRAVLTKAHWRWQEMELISKVSISGNTVTITLNEQLLDGLKWGLTFPEGAFTDKAGNKAAALGTYTSGNVDTTVNSPYWFWSNGVQAPVIRVNRKSYDARTTAWSDPKGRNYSPPANLGSADTAADSVPGGWGIRDFKYVHYRIESETPGATLTYATEEGTTANNGSITALWTGTIAAVSGSNRTWDRPDQTTTTAGVGTTVSTDGEWVLNNLVRRSRIELTGTTATAGSYTVQESGLTISRVITTQYQGYRSYNRDVTKNTLDTKTLAPFSGFQGVFSYEPMQASKNYVVAQASIQNGGTTYTSGKSYEGVFRSVVALKQDTFAASLNGINRDNNPIMVQGSNVKNGMPSISGFPVYDAGETDDNRFVKIFYYESFNGNSNSMTNGRLYWVSTEIVSQWYFLACGYSRITNTDTGGTHSQHGDVNNYLYSGYGDLTYCRNLR